MDEDVVTKKKVMNILKQLSLLLLNYFYDFLVFVKYSGVFSSNSEGKILAKLIFNYHSIEKGLINEQIRYRFGERKIKRIFQLIEIWNRNKFDTSNSQFVAVCSVLVKYYDIHKENNIDISDIISDDNYKFIKLNSKQNIGGILSFEYSNYFSKKNADFGEFSGSRHSVRHFADKKIPLSVIENVVNLSRNAPSVCNRQSVVVHFVDNKQIVMKVLNVQSGLNATSDMVQQILIITSSVSSFVSPVERNQMFVDGGIFLQNTLYALHYYGIAACALNWSKPFFYENRVRKYINIHHKERIIAVIAIGYPKEQFKVPFSKRKEVSEILHVIND